MKKILYASLMIAAAAFCSACAGAQVIVVANSSVTANSVSMSELRDVFTGASNSLHGARVKPVLLKEGPVHTQFLSDYLQKAPVAFVVTWRGLVMSGQGTMPRTLDTEAAMVDYVSRTPGAIGYISKSVPHDGVKVLEVH